ncbi:major facilitator superfamily domain-containing protein [Lipomyces oligophaga]|uniref:major facilitator superfamily domain-containing protein n=1 Tax=Lipomyces oligophaga TaxID=45792 RepID=UPI0034CFC5EA
MEKRLKRKLDFTILPLMVGMYILNYLDRNNIAAAKLGTLMQDLNLSSTQYSTCVSILFVSYIIMQIPSNLILARIPRPNIYLPLIMTFWGILSACVGEVQSFGPLVALRILIGAFEAGFYPGVIYYLSCWYTRLELAKRSAIFILGSYLSGAFSGLIAYAVMQTLDGAHGKAAWRWLFIIEGVATVGFALLSIPILPSLPQNTRWLTKEERLLGVVRLLEDMQITEEETRKGVVMEAGDDPTEGKWQKKVALGLRQALSDPKVLVFFQIMFCISGTASINTVFPTIVESLGYERAETLLLTAPPWILCAITCFLNAVHSDRTGERFYHMIWGPTVSLIGFVIGISTTKIAPRYVAIMILLQIYNSWGVAFAWITNTINQPPMKRAAAIAVINIGFNVPNIFMPYLYTSGMSPHFYAGFGVCIMFAFFSVCGCFVMRFLLIRLNKRLAQGEIIDGMDGSTGFRFLY